MAAVVALTTAFVVWELAARPNVSADFTFLWQATRLWAAGRDPYAMRPWVPDWPLADRLFYPLPALIVVWPLQWLSRAAATAIFVAVPAGLLSWSLSRAALWPVITLATPSFVMAVVLGQWTPWLVLAMLWPTLGFMFACKPTLGLACFLYRPSWRSAFGSVALVFLSLALWPGWPAEWLRNLSSVTEHPAPIATPVGGVLALALLRWRRSDGRLLLAMACVPQLLLFADQLPLLLIARSRREAMLLSVGGWVAAGFWFVRESTKDGAVSFAAPYVLAGCYLPALWIVLRRPNEGPVPAWLERLVSSWPAWMRGGAGASTIA
ncbi:MAG: hypothetical protein ABIP93_06310 [Gemmatimonadaceae bacterium]